MAIAMRKRSEVARVERPREEAVVRDSGSELRDEIARQEAKVDFVQRPQAARGRELSGGFERIVERVFVDDPLREYDELERALQVGNDHASYGALMRALDKAETNARRAHKLWMSAKVERASWELDNEVHFGAMRAEATKSLQREKELGLRSKQITDADVAGQCAQMFPDEYRAQEAKRARAKAMEESLANLAEVWMIRCKSLQTMLGRVR